MGIEEIREFYAKAAQERSVAFLSSVSQEVRLESLSRFVSSGQSLLDVGCGGGRLLDFLREKGKDVSYKGLDLVSSMIDWARTEHPKDSHLFEDTPLEAVSAKFDWVVASAIFDISADAEMVKAVFFRMFALCTEGAAFTALWKDPSRIRPGRDESLIDPLPLVEWARKQLSQRVLLDFSYAPHCYSLFAWKKPSRWMEEWNRTGGW